MTYPKALWQEVWSVARDFNSTWLLYRIFGNTPDRKRAYMWSPWYIWLHIQLLWLALGRARCRSAGKHEITGSRLPEDGEVWLDAEYLTPWCQRCKRYLCVDPGEC